MLLANMSTLGRDRCIIACDLRSMTHQQLYRVFLKDIIVRAGKVVTSSLITWRTCTFRFSTPALNHLSSTTGPRLVTSLCALCHSDYGSSLVFPRLSSRGRRLLVLKTSACSKAETGGEVLDLQLQHRLPS